MKPLIAIGLSMILLLTLMEFFINFRRIHLQIDQIIEEQEKTRIFYNIFQQAKNNAGFIGCRKLSPDLPVYQDDIPSEATISENNFSQIFSAEYPPEFISEKPVSDVHVFRYLRTPTAKLISMPENDQLVVGDLPIFKTGDLILVADCERVHVLYVTHVSHSAVKKQQMLTLSRNITPKFQQADVGKLMTVAFYQAHNTRGQLVWYEDVLGRGKEEMLVENGRE